MQNISQNQYTHEAMAVAKQLRASASCEARKMILLNGPPRSGKDTLAAAIALYNPNTEIIRLAYPLLLVAFAMFPHINANNYDEMKSVPLPNNTLTLRAWIIKFATEFAKPTLGKNVFVNIALEKIRRSTADIIIVVDLGFNEELEELLAFVADRRSNELIKVVLARIHRNGYDYSSDSRTYLHANHSSINARIENVDIENNGTEEEFIQRSIDILLRS